LGKWREEMQKQKEENREERKALKEGWINAKKELRDDQGKQKKVQEGIERMLKGNAQERITIIPNTS
jgi:hypothetical protein